MTWTSAPSSAPSSMASHVFFTAKRRMAGSLAVKAPSLKIGRQNKLVVAMGTFMPVSSSACRNRLMIVCPSDAEAPYGTKSLSWKEIP